MAFAQEASSASSATVIIKTTSVAKTTGTIRSFRENRFVLASIPAYQGQTTAAFPQDVNPGAVESTPETTKKSGVKKWLFIAAAGAAVGIVIAVTRSGSGPDSPGGSGSTITVGTPTVGAPQ